MHVRSNMRVAENNGYKAATRDRELLTLASMMGGGRGGGAE